jgi:hypothetical protein
MATEATILKRDVYWDVSVGGSTVQIRVWDRATGLPL